MRQLYRALLLHPVRQESDAAVRWTLTESDVLERLRTDLSPEIHWRLVSDESGAGADGDDGEDGRLADSDDEATRRATFDRDPAVAGEHRAASELWHACVEAVAIMRSAVARGATPVRHRELILAVEPTLDTDALVHPLLIRVCAAFLDQGVAGWAMPGRDRGLWQAAAELYGGRLGPCEPWSERLPAALRQAQGLSADECVAGELDRLGVPPEHREAFITRSLLALRGWAGMIRQFEERPDRAPVTAVPARLIDFLALRLVCDRVATEWAVRRMGLRGPAPGAGDGTLAWLWWELRDRHPPRRGAGSVCRALRLHQVAQLVGLTGEDIRTLDENELLRLEHAIAAFDATTRRRLFHLAYERRHRIEILDALEAHAAVARPPAEQPPAAQWVFCIDERCESFRRHVEELGADHETFGTAGFFAVPMYYRGLDDWHAAPLCPIVMRPTNTVVEVPRDEAVARHEFRRSVRRRYGRLAESLSAGSRSLVRGGLFTPVIGALAAIPLVARVAFPRLTARLGRTAAALAGPRIPTRLELERTDAPALVAGTLSGFDVDEMAGIVRRVLEDIGLTARLSRVVAVVGHGSSSRNNPHESAYDCGACGGGRGGPNARAFALMANDPAVRVRLAGEGLEIPADTLFVAGMLDTCTSRVRWEDVDRVPATHAAAFATFRAECVHAGALDARERCRRFDSVPLDASPAEALRRVEERAGDLAQVRPEYGHATTAVCVVGPRGLTRGLYLERRAFLVSYDPSSDADGRILERTLAAV
ncbi:MAG: putative inorganic carbon transporter subunit DabA, partial [Planctomycetia bacterium]